HREVETSGGVERFPELAFRGRALAERHVGQLVAVRGASRQVRAPSDVARRLRAADRGQALAGGHGRLAHDVESGRSPMAGHLPAARCRVGRRPDRLHQHLERRDPERQREGAIAVVGEEPVVAGAQGASEAEQQRLVSRARDLEERAVLLAKRDLTVVAEARHEREAEVVERFVEICVERSVECGVVHCSAVYDLVWVAVTQSVPLPWRRRAARDTGRFLSPAVRNLAGELDVDAASLLGRGTGGRVTRADVLAAAGAPVSVRDEVVPFDNVRRRTAIGLLASKRAIPHALVVAAADYGAIGLARRAGELTALPFVARAVVDALHEFPLMNATTAEDGLSVV